MQEVLYRAGRYGLAWLVIPPIAFKRDINLVIVDHSVDPLFFRIKGLVDNAPPTGANAPIPLREVSQLTLTFDPCRFSYWIGAMRSVVVTRDCEIFHGPISHWL